MKIFREKKIAVLLKNTAFTLVEIILVVLLLSVVAGLTIPNFRKTFQKVQLQNSADHIVYAMRYAQSRAIINSTLVRFEFDQNDGCYWLVEQSKEEDDHFVKLFNKMGKVFRMPEGINMISSNIPILFYPDGRIEKRDIKLCSEGGCLLISTRGQRGHVNVFKVEN